jgi:Alpha/beta hydrolase of unknown function (DUF900)
MVVGSRAPALRAARRIGRAWPTWLILAAMLAARAGGQPPVRESAVDAVASDAVHDTLALATDAVDAMELWSVSTRGPGNQTRGCNAAFAPRVVCHVGCHTWRASSLDQLWTAMADGRVNVVFLHGNNYTDDDARNEGLNLARRMSPSTGGPPARLIVWSWPSEREGLWMAADAREKAVATEGEACRLRQFLEPLPPSVQVSLVGHSFGARIATGALHLLGSEAPETPTVGPRIRAVLVAAAMENDWLRPSGRHGAALARAERTVITFNRADTVLRFYAVLDGLGGPRALGDTGLLAAPDLADVSDRLTQFSTRCWVGHGHFWRDYMKSPGAVRRIRAEALYQLGPR